MTKTVLAAAMTASVSLAGMGGNAAELDMQKALSQPGSGWALLALCSPRAPKDVQFACEQNVMGFTMALSGDWHWHEDEQTSAERLFICIPPTAQATATTNRLRRWLAQAPSGFLDAHRGAVLVAALQTIFPCPGDKR